MPYKTEDQIRLFREQHTGLGNEVSLDRMLDVLAAAGHFPGRAELRGIIREMRQAGELICSNDSGYYWPADLGEALEFVRQFKEPAGDRMKTARIFKRAAQAEFGQQLRMQI
jgi:hypothetical protein